MTQIKSRRKKRYYLLEKDIRKIITDAVLAGWDECENKWEWGSIPNHEIRAEYLAVMKREPFSDPRYVADILFSEFRKNRN